MTLRFIALMFATAATVVSTVQADDEPSSMLGFLEPGSKVSVHVFQNSGDIVLRAYSEEESQIAIDAEQLDLDAVAEKYSSLQRRIQKAKEHVAKKHSHKDPKIVAIDDDRNFGTIKHVGSDYVVIEMDGQSKRRRVFSRDSIKRIYLDDPGVALAATFGAYTIYFDHYSSKGSTEP